MHLLAERLPHADIERATEITATLDARVKEAHNHLRVQLCDPHFVDLLDDVVKSVREPLFSHDPADRAAHCMGDILQRVYKKTRKTVRKAGAQPSDRALHCIRIKSKHLRYAAEAFAEVAGARAQRYAACVKRLQDMLGEQHDGVVALKRLREIEGSPSAHFAAGELAMLAVNAGGDACDKWRATWQKIAKRRNRFW